jgi:hypothetical protein
LKGSYFGPGLTPATCPSCTVAPPASTLATLERGLGAGKWWRRLLHQLLAPERHWTIPPIRPAIIPPRLALPQEYHERFALGPDGLGGGDDSLPLKSEHRIHRSTNPPRRHQRPHTQRHRLPRLAGGGGRLDGPLGAIGEGVGVALVVDGCADVGAVRESITRLTPIFNIFCLDLLRAGPAPDRDMGIDHATFFEAVAEAVGEELGEFGGEGDVGG